MKIKEGFFWKNYCYFFTANGKQVEHPKNLCNYFWTAIFGMGKAFGHSLTKINAFCYLLLTTSFFFSSYGIYYAFPDTIIPFFPIIIMLGCFVGVFIKSIQSFGRLVGDKASDIILIIFLIVGVVFLIVGFVGDFIINPPTWQNIEKGFLSLLWIGLRSGMYGIVLGVIIILGCFLFNRASTTDFFKTIVAFLIAKKQKICPLVQPPEPFKEKIK